MAHFDVDGLELGFGSPTTFNLTTSVEFVGGGFGAPQTITDTSGNTYSHNQEQYFGDPHSNVLATIFGKEDLLLPDNGGEVLQLRGPFEQLFDTFDIPSPQFEKPVGPFFAKFISEDVSGREYDAFSGIASYKTQLYTDITGKSLTLCTPVMEQGDYKLRIFYGQGRIEFFEFSDTLKVVHRLRNDKTLSIKSQCPNYWNVSERTDAVEIDTQYLKRKESNLSKIIHSVGQNFNNVYNSDYTLTKDQTLKNETILEVESTIDFPSKGVLHLDDGHVLNYTGKTHNTFTGISGIHKPIEKRVRVAAENLELNVIDNFYKVQNNGFYKPLAHITEKEWLSAFQIVEYNERASEKVIFEYFYQLMKKINLIKQVNITGSIVSAPLDSSAWNCSHIQRYCKITGADGNGRYFFIVSADPNSATQLQLSEVGSSYFNGAVDKPQGRENGFTTGQYTIEILPWNISQDDRGVFEIELEKTVFNSFQGYIDKDYIDRNIFLDGSDLDNNTQRNLNLDIFVAAGVFDRLRLRRQCDEFFGTYFRTDVDPSVFQILPTAAFAL